MIPQAQRGLNRGRGAIRRHNSATAANPPSVSSATAATVPSSSSQATARRASTGTAASAAADGSLASAAEDGVDLEEPMELSVEPVSPGLFSIFQHHNYVMLCIHIFQFFPGERRQRQRRRRCRSSLDLQKFGRAANQSSTAAAAAATTAATEALSSAAVDELGPNEQLLHAAIANAENAGNKVNNKGDLHEYFVT